MARKKTVEEVRAQREKAEKQKKLYEQKLKILTAQEKELERRARTHQLCVRGGMLEHYLDPNKTRLFTDDEVDEILRTAVQLPEIIELLSKKDEETEVEDLSDDDDA